MGAPVIVLAALPAMSAEIPEVLVDGEARGVAVRLGDDRYAVYPVVRGVTADTWSRRLGGPVLVAVSESAPADGARCDRLGCILRSGARRVAVVRDQRALAEDCAAADVVVVLVTVRRACSGRGRGTGGAGAKVVIDLYDLRRDGAHAVYFGTGKPRVETVAAARGDRPWSSERLSGRVGGQ
jgi:competence protein ComEC